MSQEGRDRSGRPEDGFCRLRYHEWKGRKPFKTREGGVMRLENLIADIDEAAYNRIMENRTVSEDEAKKRLRS